MFAGQRSFPPEQIVMFCCLCIDKLSVFFLATKDADHICAFQLDGKFGIGRSGGIRNAILISLTSEERRARPHMGYAPI
jgi:hypothetical protein